MMLTVDMMHWELTQGCIIESWCHALCIACIAQYGTWYLLLWSKLFKGGGLFFAY